MTELACGADHTEEEHRFAAERIELPSLERRIERFYEERARRVERGYEPSAEDDAIYASAELANAYETAREIGHEITELYIAYRQALRRVTEVRQAITHQKQETLRRTFGSDVLHVSELFGGQVSEANSRLDTIEE